MYIRVSRARFDPARSDEVQPILDELVAVVAAGQGPPGLQNYYHGADRMAGTAIAITVWDTEEHARFNRAELGDIVTRLQALGVQMEPAEIYEVTAQG